MLNSKGSFSKVGMRFVYFVGCFIVSVLIFSMFLHVRINGFGGSMFGAMIYGKAPKPWVYRALLPFGVLTVASAVPKEAKSSLNQRIWESEAFKKLNKRWRWEESLLTEYLIACVFMYLSLVGFFFAFRYLFESIYKAPRMLLDSTSLLALLALPVMFRFYSYVYDLVTLFLFTLGLALMARNKWLLFFLIYTLACFNKETTILLTMLFVIYFWCCSMSRLDKPLFTRLLLVQIGIFLGVRLVLFYFFHDNPGKFVYLTLIKHNLTMAPYRIGSAVGFLFITLTILYKWKEKPLFLRCGLWMLVPLFSLCFFYGWLDELRDYYEVYPVVILLMAYTFGDILEWKAMPRMILTTNGKKLLINTRNE